MTRHLALLILTIGAIVALGTVSVAATQDATPQQQLARAKQQLRAANAKISDQQDEIAAQDATISDQGDTIARLRARLANQPDPLDVITARDPDGLWQAMRAIWLAMPTLDPGALCGYDRSNVPADDGPGLTLTSYTFYAWRNC